ncbi:MAG: N-acetylmuramoyl-L-alanine amidase [Deltaproteobacteria bacterium]|nr:N-acetylmuramoyl-L-alanine amidase [Deltaproteobacteria bacterium]
MKTIVIDSGHGGHVTAGRSSANAVVGPGGTLEKTLTLDVARRLRAHLPDHRVLLTRDRDVNVTLGGRAQIACRERADVFLGLHFNGDRDPRVQGTETFVHHDAGHASRTFAGRVQRALAGATGHHDRGVAREELAVLSPAQHASNTAACLAEISFLSDPREEQRLRSPDYRERLAGALAGAVREQLGEPPRAFGRGAARALEETAAPAILSFTSDAEVAAPGGTVTVRWSIVGAFSRLEVWPGMQEQPLAAEGSATVTIDPENVMLDGTVLVVLIATPVDGSEPVYQPLSVAVTSGAPAGAEELHASLGAAPSASGAEGAPVEMAAALDLPSVQTISYWADLISFRPPATLQTAVPARDASWFFHHLEGAPGSVSHGAGDVNLDFYPVHVTTMPDKPGGGKYTPEEWLEYFRSNINDFIDTSYSRFAPYSARYATGSQDAHWTSAPPGPLGAIVSIDIPAISILGATLARDDGSVCCARSRGDQWIFATLHTTRDGDHPVAGNRQFGFIRMNDGSVAFFTRGADRATGILNNAPIANYMVFRGGHKLWQSFQRGMKSMVDARGGSATIKPPYSNRVWWTYVRDLAHSPTVAWI